MNESRVHHHTLQPAQCPEHFHGMATKNAEKAVGEHYCFERFKDVKCSLVRDICVKGRPEPAGKKVTSYNIYFTCVAWAWPPLPFSVRVAPFVVARLTI